MKKVTVSEKCLDLLRNAAREADQRAWDDQRRRDVTEALREADDKIKTDADKE